MINKQEELKKQQELEDLILETVKNYDKSSAFRQRRIIGTPNDSYSLVNRRFVTLSSNIGARPLSSVAVTGQHFFDTTSTIPMVFDGDNWRNGVGSVVAAGRNS